MKTIHEGYALLCSAKLQLNDSFYLDAVASCLYEEYVDSIYGFEARHQLRTLRPAIYEELEEVKSEDDFAALIARLKLEGIGHQS